MTSARSVRFRPPSAEAAAEARGTQSASQQHPKGVWDYKIILYRQTDGSWVAWAPALPSCYAVMNTKEEALSELERVFEMEAEYLTERGEPFPEDVEIEVEDA
ncbi:MAG: type II toxin-antitoxin system HicB family antitoxin [Armatimonadetes bacterium]|nr:type II toxin-antitoxin system HicB family antitoxin [Armatimonadota bacterium]